jgi:hypothetical protein
MTTPTAITPSTYLPTGLPPTLGTLTIDQQTALVACFTGENVTGTVFPDGSTFTFPLQKFGPGTPSYSSVVYDMLWDNWLKVMYPAVYACRMGYSALIASGNTAAAMQLLSAAMAAGIPLWDAPMIEGWGWAAVADQCALWGYTAWILAYGQQPQNGVYGGSGSAPLGSVAISPVPPIVTNSSAAPTSYSLGVGPLSVMDMNTGKIFNGVFYTTPESDPPVGAQITVGGVKYTCITIFARSGFIATEGLFWSPSQ